MRTIICLLLAYLPTITFAQATCEEATASTAVGIVTTVVSGEEKPVMVSPISDINVYPLENGAPILWNSKIVTDARSSVMITLLDQSTLMIGPNSEVLMDGFIFNPCKKMDVAGTLKGFARVISGNKIITGKQPAKSQVGYAGFRG